MSHLDLEHGVKRKKSPDRIVVIDTLTIFRERLLIVFNDDDVVNNNKDDNDTKVNDNDTEIKK